MEETRENIEPATTNVVRINSPYGQYPHPETSYLDALDDFDRLRKNGLPGRHTRRSKHRTLFEAARVYRWSILQMAREWRRIIKRNPEATVESVKSAGRDMVLAWKAANQVRIYLPDVTKLPEPDRAMWEMLQTRSIGLGCKEPLKAGKIVEKVILPLILSRPRQCQLGKVRIRSAQLRDAVHIRGQSRDYKNLWGWMQKAKIITCVNSDYVPGSRARQYGINIALVLWLCGFRTEELDWSPVAKNIWPELSRMRVINDIAFDHVTAGGESVAEG